MYIEDLDRWIRVDARGNKQNIHAEFRLDGENLAYPIRLEYGEIDYHNNGMDLDPKLVDVLNGVDRVSDIRTDFEYFPS